MSGWWLRLIWSPQDFTDFIFGQFEKTCGKNIVAKNGRKSRENRFGKAVWKNSLLLAV